MIIGLCKTNSCNEFIEAILFNLLACKCDKIVFVHSDKNWLNQESPDDLKDIIKEWKAKYDKGNQIIQLEYVSENPNQAEQYHLGYRYIKENFPTCEWIYIFDSDEYIDDTNWDRLIKYAKDYWSYNSIATNMYTYIKSPFFRVEPSEFCKPTIFIRPVRESLQHIRGNGLFPKIIPEDLYIHHFTYVRKNEEDVFKKIWTSLQGDRDDVPQTQLVDMDFWVKEKWNKLPFCKDLHTTKHFEKSWHSIKNITLNELPKFLHNTHIIKQYLDTAREE